MMRLAILVVALFAGLQSTVAVTTHVVGDTTGWVVPAEGPIFYAAWSAEQTFILGDILYFNFTTGAEDVARVTAEAFLTCNSTSPISLVKTGPANFSLNCTGEYYFIGTLDSNCFLGQKLAINVTTSRGPTLGFCDCLSTADQDNQFAPASHIYSTIPDRPMGIAKEMGTGTVTGIISQLIFSILLKCFKAMLKTFRQQTPPVGQEEVGQELV